MIAASFFFTTLRLKFVSSFRMMRQPDPVSSGAAEGLLAG